MAEKSSSGDLYVCLAENYLVGHEWGQALYALQRRVKKEGGADPDSGY